MQLSGVPSHGGLDDHFWHLRVQINLGPGPSQGSRLHSCAHRYHPSLAEWGGCWWLRLILDASAALAFVASPAALYSP
jgi:hypothetical protein